MRELFDAVYRDPTSDEAREVLADALMERGDPRGEMIRLQLDAQRRELGDDEKKRLASLFEAHKWEWLGPLRDWLDGARFERGFLTEALLRLRPREGTFPLGDGMWRTVEKLRLVTNDPSSRHFANIDVARILTAQQFPVLREAVMTGRWHFALAQRSFHAFVRGSLAAHMERVTFEDRRCTLIVTPGPAVRVVLSVAGLAATDLDFDDYEVVIRELRAKLRAIRNMQSLEIQTDVVPQPPVKRDLDRLVRRWRKDVTPNVTLSMLESSDV